MQLLSALTGICIGRAVMALLYFFYFGCQSASFSHPLGNPSADKSISGYSTNNFCKFNFKSLFGAIVLRKNAIMHKSKYMRSVSVGNTIHG